MRILKGNLFFICFFGGIFFAFLWPLIFLKHTFIKADYGVQFYPWMHYYADCLREGRLPYWTNLIANGFPLLAEGQIGAYYPLHLLFYSVLPFFVAYTWLIPLHIAVGGIGFYLYCQKIGLGKDGAALAAVIFSFSSVYGGSSYAMASLRVITWLPYLMLTIEHLSGARGRRRVAWISLGGIFVALMWTGGSPQFAAYAVGYLFLLALFRTDAIKICGRLSLCVVAGVLAAMPQIFATWELGRASTRMGQDASFALWGSVPPPAFIALILPQWGGFFRTDFYIGLWPVAFAIFAFFYVRSRHGVSHAVLAVLFMLLAIGKYNPVYSALVQKFSLTFFRVPQKFLLFAMVSLGVLAGMGFDRLITSFSAPDLKRSRRIMAAIAAMAAALPCFLGAVFYAGRDFWTRQAHRYADAVFFGKIDPIHPAAHYHTVVNTMLTRILDLADYRNPWNLWAVFLALAGALVLGAAAKQKFFSRHFKVFTALCVAADLIVFGHFLGSGFIGNAAPVPEKGPSLLLERLREDVDPNAGFYSFAEFPGRGRDEVLPPNSNMLYGIAHPGGYSPLLLNRYYKLTKDLGFVDCSLGKHPFDEGVWLREKKILDCLGVRYVLSGDKIDWPGLSFSGAAEGRFLYRNVRALPQVSAVYRWKVISEEKGRLAYLKSGVFDPANEAVLEDTMAGEVDVPAVTAEKGPEAYITSRDVTGIRVRMDLENDAMVVFRNAYYPRWKVEVDGRPKPLLPINEALCGVFSTKGRHEIRFFYDMVAHRLLEISSASFLAVLILANFCFWRKKHENF